MSIIANIRVFDDDQSGTMDFGEFVLATNCTSLSDPQAKVRWHLFGLGGDDLDLFGLGGDYLDLVAKFDSRQHFLPHSWIFDVFDEDGGGTIELDEVIKLVGAKNLKITNIGITYRKKSRAPYAPNSSFGPSSDKYACAVTDKATKQPTDNQENVKAKDLEITQWLHFYLFQSSIKRRYF